MAFLDSDDLWYPDKLLRCVPHLDQGADLVCHGLRYIGEREGNMYCGPQRRATFDALLDEGNCITPSATVVRKDILELVGAFSEDPAIVTSEDYHLWIKLAKAGTRMRFIKEILGEYRIHSGSQSASVLRHLKSVLSVVGEFLPESSSDSVMRRMRLRRRLALAYYGAGRAMQENGQFAEAWLLLLSALAHWPFYSKAYAALFLNVFGLVRLNLLANRAYIKEK